MTKHIVKTEADWLELRKQYVTASEASVLVGADPYSSPAKLRNPEPFSGNAFTFVGQMLEPIVVNVTNKVLGTSFQLYENMEGHKEFYTEDGLGATPDAHEDRKILLECKTTRPHTFLKYSAVPPSKYLIQVLVQMHCTGLDEGYLSIMSTDLTQETSTIKWPVAIYKIWKCGTICDILKTQAAKFKQACDEGKSFRVDSKVKQRVRLLLTLCYKKII